MSSESEVQRGVRTPGSFEPDGRNLFFGKRDRRRAQLFVQR